MLMLLCRPLVGLAFTRNRRGADSSGTAATAGAIRQVAWRGGGDEVESSREASCPAAATSWPLLPVPSGDGGSAA